MMLRVIPSLATVGCLLVLSAAVPAPHHPAYGNAFAPGSPREQTSAPRRTSGLTGSTPIPNPTPIPIPTATTTGAKKAPTTLATAIAPRPPSPTHTYFNPDGELRNPAPAPYMPAGGLGTDGTEPRYAVNSDYDFESLALALYHEWIELDLFRHGLEVFSEADFARAGLTAEDRIAIGIMAEQETGHATLLSAMLGPAAPVPCSYNYPFRTVREFVDFNQKLTRWSESGVMGYIHHLDSREAAQLLGQTIAVEGRQQQIFRQMSGLFPVPAWFVPGIPQSWAWTFLAQYVVSCPANQTRLSWQNFPNLYVVNQPNINRLDPDETGPFEVVGDRSGDPSISTLPKDESCLDDGNGTNVIGYDCSPAIARTRTEPLSFAGKKVFFTWDEPGQAVGPNNSYVTTTQAGQPKFVAWVAQLNLTYTDLTVTGPNQGFSFQPADEVFEGDPVVNGTMFVALTDSNLYLTPFNISMINPHVRALGIYQAG